jgi:hypothetical protein
MRRLNSTQLLGVGSVILGVFALLLIVQVAEASTFLCRTVARASPKTPFLIHEDPPTEPDDWEPADPNDPDWGITCETISCNQPCTVGIAFEPGGIIKLCECGDRIDSCALMGHGNAGGFTHYSCQGECDIGDCTLKVSNVLFEFLPGGMVISADIECLCQ